MNVEVSGSENDPTTSKQRRKCVGNSDRIGVQPATGAQCDQPIGD